MFDSHCHLDFPEFQEDLDAVLVRARAAGVRSVLVPGARASDWPRQDALRGRQGISLASGFHPWFLPSGESVEGMLGPLGARLRQTGAAALGECGLDAKHKATSLLVQTKWFEAQLALAKELELPVIVHQVGARAEFLRSLGRVGLTAAGGVVHSFSGDSSWATALVQRGFHLGLGPALGRPSRGKLRQAARDVPLSRILVETDGPDQAVWAPGARSGQLCGGERPGGQLRGEPQDVVLVVRALAEALGLSEQAVGVQTAKNAESLFHGSSRVFS